MKVGYTSDGYPHKRNIIGKIEGYEYISVENSNHFIVKRKLRKKVNRLLHMNVIKAIPDENSKFKETKKSKDIDVYHFYNLISYSNTPWVSTYETLLPRFKATFNCHSGIEPDYSTLKGNKEIEQGLEALASNACRGILPMSECTKKLQLDFLKHFPKYAEAIEKKIFVMHPPQELQVENIESKKNSYSEKLRFLFVGGAFHRKGGKEIVNVFEKLRNDYEFELIIVSKFDRQSWAKKETEEDIAQDKVLVENTPWLQYYESLPNEEVLKLMKNCHVGLLPTWADTYGFSVLEMQASGCPVISTDIRALPEINNDEIGWMINVPKNRLGEAIYTTEDDRSKLGRAIEKGLEEALISIFNDREAIYRKAIKAHQRIKVEHSPVDYANKLKAIYSNKAAEILRQDN